MASEWRHAILGSLTDWTSGGTPSKQEPSFWNGDIPWISAVSMKTGRLNDSELKITALGLEHGSRLAPERSVLILVRGSELHKRIPIGMAMRPLAFNQDVKALKARNGLLPEFLLYWLLGNEQFLLEKVEHTGIGAGKLDTSILKNLNVVLPCISEQRAIAHILGTLDDKIELNRRMNEKLEAMAKAIFKSYFVDFDPVIDNALSAGNPIPSALAEKAARRRELISRASAEGRDFGLAKHIADLFPNRFVDSELGPIPAGWGVGSFGDFAEHPRRGVRPEELVASTPYIALEHMPKHCIALSEWSVADAIESNKFEFKRGEILFGKLRPYFHKVGVAPVDGVCSTDIVVIAPKAECWFGFVLAHVSSEAFVEYANAGSIGTKMPRTSWTDMARYCLVIPPVALAAEFNGFVFSAVERILTSIRESRTIAALRDTLLSQLISGELRVNEAKRSIGDATK